MQAPANDVFHFHRALCFIESGRHREALPDLHLALESNSSDSGCVLESIHDSVMIHCAIMELMLAVCREQDAVLGGHMLLSRAGAARMPQVS